MGYANAASLRTGVRGWNDYEQVLVETDGSRLDLDAADELLASTGSAEQQGALAANVA